VYFLPQVRHVVGLAEVSTTDAHITLNSSSVMVSGNILSGIFIVLCSLSGPLRPYLFGFLHVWQTLIPSGSSFPALNLVTVPQAVHHIFKAILSPSWPCGLG
jgi:hypothetical protein